MVLYVYSVELKVLDGVHLNIFSEILSSFDRCSFHMRLCHATSSSNILTKRLNLLFLHLFCLFLVVSFELLIDKFDLLYKVRRN